MPHKPTELARDEAVESLMNDATLDLGSKRTDPIVAEIEAQRHTAPRSRETWFILPRAWYTLFRTDPMHAPPLDLAPLRDEHSNQIRPGAREGIDYELVPKPAWDTLVARYGLCSTPIACSVVPGVHAHQAPRIELYPPHITLVRFGAANAPSGNSSLRVSAAITLAQLKAKVRAQLALHVPDADMRFVRLPEPLRARAALQRNFLRPAQLHDADPPVEIVEGADTATLAALQLDAPSMLLAVDVRANGTWQWNGAPREAPRHMTRSHTSAALRGLRGLANLGNTCFMNSALQCLSNTPELQEFFAKDVHWEELNAENPLGMGGAIAAAFGRLMQQLWAGNNTAVVPREFKMALARFAPQFTGYAQQDSQELLAFLLDGLHEDLNRILKKPYIEAPDWHGGTEADMVHFARQQWDIYKARNDSVIVDLFQGQYRSTLVCPVCNKVSIKFDPFMYLTLPIPNTRKWRGSVLVVPQHGKIVQVDVQLPATANIAMLRDRVASLTHINPARLAIGEVWSHHIYRWLAEYEPVRDIASGDHVYFWETAQAFTLPAPLRGNSRFSFFHRANRTIEEIEKSFPAPAQPDMITLPVFSCYAPADTHATRRAQGEGFGLPFFVTIPRAATDNAEAIYAALEAQYVRFSKYPDDIPAEFHARLLQCSAFRVHFAVPSAHEPMHRGDQAPELGMEPLETRIARLQNADGWPVLFQGGALYCIWNADAAAALLQETAEDYVWGTHDVIQDAAFQRGTTALSNGKGKPRLALDDCLAEFIKPEQLGQDDLWYCPHCKAFREAMKKFDLWKVPDILVVHLKRFSAGRMARDKLDTYIDFPIEGLDLTEMAVGAKIMRDMHEETPPAETQVGDKYVVPHDPHDDAVAADQPIYDLYAVDNHFGGLGGGHYTAFAKNPTDDRWYNYDDSSVRPVNDPEAVKTAAAYLLFYRRRTARPIGGKSRDKMQEKLHASSSMEQHASDTYLHDTPLPPSDSESSSDESSQERSSP
ncbi:ubiquitinyl hydrolase 1 [Malassezia vespertilionis]|uniref:Ubiquitin carboxyl-terminal hydrolase n=1 Tax=Malassezia vespertilionis TaxID=2020962 RepID=A0A2N1JB71_9BASI|nr:ubiquitinyl hydrolase 1 [Malassezia vespertilionis]PKI83803.1 Ubp12p [Malassezia vespertilionis]WFD06951.1 ubiquitinyl hydrolase 1 [Malassezia vespertilionis]